MDVRAENRGRPHQKMRFPAAPVVGRNFLTPGHSGVRVRNVRGKSGPKNLCLCCFFFPEQSQYKMTGGWYVDGFLQEKKRHIRKNHINFLKTSWTARCPCDTQPVSRQNCPCAGVLGIFLKFMCPFLSWFFGRIFGRTFGRIFRRQSRRWAWDEIFVGIPLYFSLGFFGH